MVIILVIVVAVILVISFYLWGDIFGTIGGDVGGLAAWFTDNLVLVVMVGAGLGLLAYLARRNQ